MVSYTITACNENNELRVLLQFLKVNILETDEVVVQLDSENATQEVRDVIESYKNQFTSLKVIEYPLNKDFATFKNNLKLHCSKDWIFNIDADEIPSGFLVQNLHDILLTNDDIDVMIVPRWNIVEGITEEHISKWRWKYDDWGRINWPDWQMRIYRNHPRINWVNKVHEKLDGFSKYTFLPEEKEYCLFHNKTIDRQEKQNNFYNTIG